MQSLAFVLYTYTWMHTHRIHVSKYRLHLVVFGGECIGHIAYIWIVICDTPKKT